jgi:outer membrane protein OmpA-like peptidoglycan-associated protein
MPQRVPAAPGPQRLDQVVGARVRTTGPGGQVVIQEPGNRTIIRQNNTTIITRNEATTVQNLAPGAQSRRRPDGVTETFYARPDGSRVFSEVDGNGRLLRRYRRDSGGRDIVIVDNRRFYRNLAIGVGAGILVGAAIIALAPPRVLIPRERYIVEYDRASDDDIYEALSAPPVEMLDRTYSLEEIRYSEPLRARVRRVDLDTIVFEIGSFEVTPDQYGQLSRIARAILRALEANPTEVFLIEGHTDRVGSDEDNLSLSDRRAEATARVLVAHFDIPLENLVTQGYGEQFPKIDVQGPEQANRRVSVRRITPLLSQKGEDDN